MVTKLKFGVYYMIHLMLQLEAFLFVHPLLLLFSFVLHATEHRKYIYYGGRSEGTTTNSVLEWLVYSIMLV